MTSYGVTDQGFLKKTLVEILDEIGDEQRAQISPSLNLQADSVLGQLNGIFGDKLRELWDVAEAIYRSQYPDSASGDSLDNIAAFTGAVRLPATNSEVGVYCTGDAATVLSTGRILSVENIPTDRFVSVADATLVAAPAHQTSHTYVIGDVVWNNDGTDRIYACVEGGFTGPASPPTGTGQAIIDGTATWAYVGDGLAYAFVPFEGEVTGPVQAPAFTLNVIETPVSGWNNATNVNDPDPFGRNTETDADFRVRRAELLRVSGSGTLEAIRSDVRDVSDVIEAFVLENVSDIIDGDGLTPHSFEVLVRGGDDDEIAAAIFNSKPAGIKTHRDPGATGRTVVITDSQGIDHDINFTRPDEIEIWVAVDIDVTDDFPTDGVDQVKQAIATRGDLLTIGGDVIVEQLQAATFTIEGVYDLNSFKVDTVNPPVATVNIAIGVRQIATFDTARISVTTNPV